MEIDRSEKQFFNNFTIPILIALILLLVSTITWVDSYSTASRTLSMDISDQITQTSSDLTEKIEEKVRIVETILLSSWLDVDSSEQLFEESRFMELIPSFYNFYEGYLTINLVDTSGIVHLVYPLEPNSILINNSIAYDVNGNPNLALEYANTTGETGVSNYITFFQGGQGITTFVPFYYNNTLQGFFNVVFRIEPLISSYIEEHPLLDTYPFVIKEGTTTVFQHLTTFDHEGDYVQELNLTYYHRSWKIYMTATPGLIEAASPFAGNSVIHLFNGVVAGVFVFFLSRYLVTINRLRIRRLEERDKYQELEQKLNKINSLSTMAGGMAHDFNNILTILQGNFSLLNQMLLDKLSESERSSFNAIELALEDGQKLTQQILQLSRDRVITNERIDLIDLIEERLKQFRTTLDRPITLDFHSDEEEIYVLVNRSRFGQVIINMLKNAVQAISESGNITIFLDVVRSDDQKVRDKVRIRVVDTGVGIPPAIIDKVLDPFFTTKSIGNGTGLGLPIAYRYITSIDGNMEIGSEVGQGTTVTIILPLADSKRDTPKEVQRTDLQNLCKYTLENAFGSTPRCLVIEDEQFIGDIVQNMYEKVGCKVQVESTGIEGLDIYQADPAYDLVVLDVNLPDLDGVEIFRNIMTINPNQHILFVTGFTDQLSLIDINNFPNVSLITKPFSKEDIYRATIKLISESILH